jgi:hypothetical protein
MKKIEDLYFTFAKILPFFLICLKTKWGTRMVE